MTDSMPSVSVIVPIYNAELWLPQSFSCFEAQSYSAIEWVLVDDGSTDKSADLCEHWCSYDARSRMLIKKQNGGTSSARNEGLRHATGEYVAFWDADDAQEPTMIEEMVGALDGSKDGVAVCSVRRIDADGDAHDIGKFDSHINTAENAMAEWLEGDVSTGPYAKLVPKALLVAKSIEFEEGVINEDVQWTAQVLAAAGTVHFLGRPLYQYIARTGSTTASFNLSMRDVFGNCRKLEAFISESYPQCWRTCESYCAKECWNIALASARRDNRRRWPELYREARLELRNRKDALPHFKTIKDKLLWLLYWSGLYQVVR